MSKPKIYEIIGKLPPKLQDAAREKLDVLLNLSLETLRQWVEAQLAGDWRTAYRLLTQGMTAEGLLEQMEKTNERMNAARKRAATHDAVIKEMAEEFLEVGLMALHAWLMG